MTVEAFSYITSLNAANPNGATDPKSEGDDHITGIKQTLLNSLPNVDGPVNPTPTEFNRLVGITSALVELAGAQTLTGDKTFSGTSTFSASTVLNGALSGTNVKDEDNMGSDSDTSVATQQSIKAYVDGTIAPTILDTPLLLLNTAVDLATYTTMSNAALTGPGASRAILRCQVTIEGDAAGSAVQRAGIWINKDATGTADWTVVGDKVGSIIAAAYTGNGNPEYSACFSEGIVNLDTSSEFKYARDSDGTPVSVSYKIWLIGYYL